MNATWRNSFGAGANSRQTCAPGQNQRSTTPLLGRIVHGWQHLVAALVLVLAAQSSFGAVAFRAATSANSAFGTATTITAAAGAYTEATGTCTNVTPAIPAGSVGDLLIAQVVVRDDATTVTMAGWNTLFSDALGGGTNYKVYLFWRQATGTAANEAPRTVAQSGTCDHLMSRITRFGNVDTTQPLETQPLPAGNWVYSNANNVDSGTQATSVANSMLVLATFAADDGTVAQDASFTQLYENADNSNRNAAISLNTRNVPATGSYGAFLDMALSTGAFPNHGVLFAVRPAPSVGNPTLTVNRPAGGTSTGDVLVATIAVTDETVGISAPSGWTEIENSVQTEGGGEHLVSYWRAIAAIGSEPASYTWTFSVDHTGAVGGITAFSGVDTISPVEDSGARLEDGDTATAHRAPSVNASAGGMLLTAHSYASSGSWTPPGGMTEAVDLFSSAATGAGGVSLDMNYELRAVSGATATRTANASGNGDEGVSHALALRPTILVVSINCSVSCATISGGSASWTVIFSSSVSGVSSSNFTLVNAGLGGAPAITGVVNVSGTTWTVTASTGTGAGSLGLNMSNTTGVTPAVINLPFTGQVYTVSAPIPMTCITDNFGSGVLDTNLWSVATIAGSFLPTVVDVGSGDFRLRLTDTVGYEATFATLKRTFPGAGNQIVVEIDYFAYGGSGADGVAVTFSDSAINSTTGGFGGSLGYANRTGIDGFGGGWLGIGLDEFGNYPNPTEARLGYPAGWAAPAPANVAAGFYKTNVSVRGSGSAQTGYYLLANTGVLATPVAPASGAAGATPYRYRFSIDHSNGTNAWVTVERDTTAPLGDAYTALVPKFDAKAANSGQTAVPASWLLSFTGSTGGSTNFHEFKQVTVCANQIVGGGPHHLEIQHGSGTGVTCAPSTLTIKACADALVPCTPYTAGVSGTLSATSPPTVNWAGGSGAFTIAVNSSTVTKDVQVTTVGSTVFGATSTPATTTATTCNFGTPGCTFTAADAGFIVTAPNHAAETTSTLTIQAVKKADNSLACVPGMTGAKTVNLKCAYNNPASGTLPVRVGGVALNAAANMATACDATGNNVSLTFGATGVATPTLQYADVGNMQINASFTGAAASIDAGLNLVGSGSFITAPASFAFSGITAGLIKAGNPFSATVTAQNASGATTPNFGRELAAESVTLASNLVSPNPLLAAGGNNPAIGNNIVSGGTFVNGVATVSNLNWGEVGIITMTANLTSGDYLGSSLTATGTSANVGRFIPDHFDTVVKYDTVSKVFMPCPSGLTCPASGDLVYGNGFVYSGQSFTAQVSARNLGGTTTQNYDSARGYSKQVTLSAWDVKGGSSANPGGGTLTFNNLPSTAFILGIATTSTPIYTFSATPIAPTDIFVRADDADGVSSLRGVSSVEGGVKVVSGRIKVSNAYGSELLPLTLTATAQYYSATGWLNSITDSVTNLTLAASYTVGAGTTAVTLTPSSGNLSGGKLSIRLGKPSAGAGIAAINPTAPAYLPVTPGRATFGVYKGRNDFIYQRESY